MKFINVINDFNDNGLAYYAGERVCVTDEKAGYFCGVGWAVSDGSEPVQTSLANVVLTVQDGSHQSNANTVE